MESDLKGLCSGARGIVGYYVPGPVTGKADYLLAEYPDIFEEVDITEAARVCDDPEIRIIVVVGNYGSFEAAAFAHSREEFENFTDKSDLRTKRYLKGPRKELELMSRYVLPPEQVE